MYSVCMLLFYACLLAREMRQKNHQKYTGKLFYMLNSSYYIEILL